MKESQMSVKYLLDMQKKKIPQIYEEVENQNHACTGQI